MLLQLFCSIIHCFSWSNFMVHCQMWIFWLIESKSYICIISMMFMLHLLLFALNAYNEHVTWSNWNNWYDVFLVILCKYCHHIAALQLWNKYLESLAVMLCDWLVRNDIIFACSWCIDGVIDGVRCGCWKKMWYKTEIV